MVTGVPMSARRFAAPAVLALVGGLGFYARAQAPASSPPSSSQTGSQAFNSPTAAQTQPAGSTSNPTVDQKTVHKKTGPYSSQSVRHTRIAEGSAPAPELTQAGDAIQKHDYVGAELLLRRVL